MKTEDKLQNMRVVLDAKTGSPIPVTTDLNIQPLTLSDFDRNGIFVKNAVIKNGNGKEVMNDQWIYVKVGGYGRIAMNVNRSNFCKKEYLKKVTILESIGNKKITPKLAEFILKVSDKLVFEKFGKTYRVFLKKIGRKFCVKKVVLYWGDVGTGGIMPAWDSVDKIYGIAYSKGQGIVDYERAFYLDLKY